MDTDKVTNVNVKVASLHSSWTINQYANITLTAPTYISTSASVTHMASSAKVTKLPNTISYSFAGSNNVNTSVTVKTSGSNVSVQYYAKATRANSSAACSPVFSGGTNSISYGGYAVQGTAQIKK